MQNPPPNQPTYGTPGASPPVSSPLGGMDPKVAGAISYIWIVGLIFFFLEKENRFVRFHAMQSILFGVANSVIMIGSGNHRRHPDICFRHRWRHGWRRNRHPRQSICVVDLAAVLVDWNGDVCGLDFRSRQSLSGPHV